MLAAHASSRQSATSMFDARKAVTLEDNQEPATQRGRQLESSPSILEPAPLRTNEPCHCRRHTPGRTADA